MPYSATAIEIMIASPGDVGHERQIVRSEVHEWNAIHSKERGQVLLPVAWDTHTSPAVGMRGQAIINKQLLEAADLLIAVFWTRIGSPTGQAVSGTVEEINKHIDAGKPAMLYFSAAPVAPESLDPDQYGALKEFKESMRERCLFEEYETAEQFREKFRRQLAQTIMQEFPPSMSEANAGSTVVPIPTGQVREPDTVPPLHRVAVEGGIDYGLSDDALALLRTAAKDKDTTVLMAQTFGGLSVQAGNRDFVEQRDPRSEARGRRIVEELTSRGLLEQRDLRGEVFSVTDDGFRVVDRADQST